MVEIEQCLIDWAYQGVTATLAAVASDPRVRLYAADVRLVLEGSGDGPIGPWDAIVLDVDNGPEFLIHARTGRSIPRLVSARRTLSWLSLALSRSGARVLRRACERCWNELHPPYASTSSKSPAVSAAFGMRSTRCPGPRTRSERLGKNVPMTQSTDAGEHRIERDTMGEVKVPAEALWKAQTQRAVENFPISGMPINSELIAALGLIKEAAAKTNAALGVLSQDYADAIEKAASEVAANLHDAEFPIDVFQTGSGTSSNMNANEVIASLATASWAKRASQ